MKKFYTLFAALILTISLVGQTFLNEDFDNDDFPPPGWVALPLGDAWVSSETSNAGGSAPEAKFDASATRATARLWSGAIDLTGHDTVLLMFKHFYSHSQYTGPALGVATRSYGGSWNSVWEISPNSNVEAEEIILVLTGGDIGAAQVQVSFYVSGTFANMNAWYIDDITMQAPGNFDLKMSQITTPGVISGPEPVGGVVTNVGVTPVTEVSVSWKSFTGDIYDSTFTGLNLDLLDTFEFTFDGTWITPFGEYDLEMWINSVNGTQDENLSNDTLVKTIAYYATVSLQQWPCFEEFTSSTCGPCYSFNLSFVPWTIQNADAIVLIKYQMNWPGNGDPYYNADGGIRRNFYGVNAVPDLFCNGDNCGANMGSVTAAFAAASQLTTNVDIAAYFTVTGDIINISTNILPFEGYGSLKVYTILMEKVTTGNVQSNGETEFHHVEMKMFPDGNGVTQDLQYLDPISLNYSYDLTNTDVEEYDDLILGIVIQDPATKNMIQAEYGHEGALSSNALLDEITLDGEPLEEFNANTYSYTVWLPVGTTSAPVVDASTQNPDAFTIISQAFELPGRAVVDVYAENLSTTKTYTIDFDIATGIDTKPRPSVQVYPNPANDQLVITGVTSARVALYSVDGKLMTSQENYKGASIDISYLNTGIYILHITTDDGLITRKKIIIM